HIILGALGTALLIAGLTPIVRLLFFVFVGDADGHIQTLVLGAALLVGALRCFALLVLADLPRTNRVLTEDLLERVKMIQYGSARETVSGVEPAHTTPTGEERDRASRAAKSDQDKAALG